MQFFKKNIYPSIRGLLWGILTCIVLTLLFGCKSVKYVPVETVRTDSVFVRDSLVVNTIIHYKDSLRIKDSTVIVLDTAGNVISKEKYHDEMRTKDTGRSDRETKAQERETKSADVEQTPVIVEKELSRWQEFQLDAFWCLVGVLGVVGVLVVLMIRKRLKR